MEVAYGVGWAVAASGAGLLVAWNLPGPLALTVYWNVVQVAAAFAVCRADPTLMQAVLHRPVDRCAVCRRSTGRPR